MVAGKWLQENGDGGISDRVMKVGASKVATTLVHRSRMEKVQSSLCSLSDVSHKSTLLTLPAFSSSRQPLHWRICLA